MYVFGYLMRSETIGRSTRHSQGNTYGSFQAQNASHNQLAQIEGNTQDSILFYVRLGAIVFAIVSIIRDGLHFGRALELGTEIFKCSGVFVVIQPILSIIFTFAQLYFIFLYSQVYIHTYQLLSRMGLIHMIATNICVWLRIVIKESYMNIISKPKGSTTISVVNQTQHISGTQVVSENIKQNCSASVLGAAVRGAHPFLYPSSVYYCVIAAAILWQTWTNIGVVVDDGDNDDALNNDSNRHLRGARLHVDCHMATRGLFAGISVLATSAICLILQHIMLVRGTNVSVAVRVVYSAEIIVLLLVSIACLVTFYKIEDLLFRSDVTYSIEERTLLFTLLGLFMCDGFKVLAFEHSHPSIGPFIVTTTTLNLVEAALQFVFICTALRRMSYKTIHRQQRPGRECLTFLLICNIALFAFHACDESLNVTYNSREKMYGARYSSLLSHLTHPLVGLYRFYSVCCLAYIWSNIYKFKTR